MAHTPWQAELRLRFTEAGGRTVLRERQHRGPLLVQRPFHPEGGPCHVYLVHPPGGVAGGDQLRLEARVEPGAHALITTPAATRFYRALPGRRATVTQHLALHDATLEWLPQESICFDGADALLRTRVDLSGQSRFIGCEMTCYGRPACGEPFASGRIQQATELWHEGRPLWIDPLRIDGGAPMHAARWGLQGATAMGWLAAWPCTPAHLESLREALTQSPSAARCSLTWMDGLLLARALGQQAADLRAALLPAWQWLRPRLLGRPAIAPRIWAT